MKSNLKIIVVDNIGGSYLPIALLLSPYFAQVSYFSVNQSPFPYIQNDMPGSGYEGITRVDEFWSNIDLYDIILFTDIYFSDWGQILRSMGKMVWGGNDSEVLETNREIFYHEKELVGLPNIHTDVITGIDNLIVFCKNNGNVWVKISYYRGQLETFHSSDYKSSEIFLDNLKCELGPLGPEIVFLVESNMVAVAEIGSDGYTCNGVFTQSLQWGIECKDSGYICKWDNREDLPPPINFVNGKFTQVLQKFGHSGNFSTEIRFGEDGKSYFTDPALRIGIPSGISMYKNISNWDEIIPGICSGKLIEPKFKNKYACELVLKDTYVNTHFLSVSFPEEYKENIFLKNSFIRNETYYCSPFSKTGFELEQFGTVCTTGDNLQDVINECLMIASKVDSYNLTYDKSAMNNIMKSVQDLKTVLNIDF